MLIAWVTPRSPSGHDAPLAQLVEQLTLNQWVRGSSPRRCTIDEALLRRSDGPLISHPLRNERADERIWKILFAEARSARRGSESPEVHHPRKWKSVSLTQRVHLFPFRTQKLSFAVPTILAWRRAGKISQSRHKAYRKALRFPVCLIFLLSSVG